MERCAALLGDEETPGRRRGPGRCIARRALEMTPTRPWNRAALAMSTCLLSLAASSALAAPGIGFAWDHCQGEGGAVQNKVFACDTNAGLDIAYGIFTLESPFDRVGGID